MANVKPTPPTGNQESVLRVSSTSNTQQVASAVAHGLYERGEVTLRAVGAAAVNQSVKAMAVARGFVAPRGMNLYVIPYFQSVDNSEGESISAIAFKVVSL